MLFKSVCRPRNAAPHSGLSLPVRQCCERTVDRHGCAPVESVKVDKSGKTSILSPSIDLTKDSQTDKPQGETASTLSYRSPAQTVDETFPQKIPSHVLAHHSIDQVVAKEQNIRLGLNTLKRVRVSETPTRDQRSTASAEGLPQKRVSRMIHRSSMLSHHEQDSVQ